MSQTVSVQTAQRLIKTLGPVARTHAMQTALDMRAQGDGRLENYWLDVADIIQEVQSRSAVALDKR